VSGADICANCGATRMHHSVGLYQMWCPDDRQPDMLPDGRWRPNSKPLVFRAALKDTSNAK
jgi:hypothetical protein